MTLLNRLLGGLSAKERERAYAGATEDAWLEERTTLRAQLRRYKHAEMLIGVLAIRTVRYHLERNEAASAEQVLAALLNMDARCVMEALRAAVMEESKL